MINFFRIFRSKREKSKASKHFKKHFKKHVRRTLRDEEFRKRFTDSFKDINAIPLKEYVKTIHYHVNYRNLFDSAVNEAINDGWEVREIKVCGYAGDYIFAIMTKKMIAPPTNEWKN